MEIVTKCLSRPFQKAETPVFSSVDRVRLGESRRSVNKFQHCCLSSDGRSRSPKLFRIGSGLDLPQNLARYCNWVTYSLFRLKLSMALKLYSTFQSSASGFPHHREESLESDDYASGLSSKTRVSPLSSRLDSRIHKTLL